MCALPARVWGPGELPLAHCLPSHLRWSFRPPSPQGGSVECTCPFLQKAFCMAWLMVPFCRVAVEVVTTMTSADVMWQDGSVECNIRSNDLFPVHHLDNNEFCPGDFVVDKRGSASSRGPLLPRTWAGLGTGQEVLGSGDAPLKVACSSEERGEPFWLLLTSPRGTWALRPAMPDAWWVDGSQGAPPGLLSPVLSGSLVQSCPDPAVYGVVQSGDHVGRTCVVKWFKLRPSGDDVEVSAAPVLWGGLSGWAWPGA